jgi:hypothetical protein
MTILAGFHINGVQRAAFLVVTMIRAAVHIAADVGIGILPVHEKIPLKRFFAVVRPSYIARFPGGLFIWKILE